MIKNRVSLKTLIGVVGKLIKIMLAVCPCIILVLTEIEVAKDDDGKVSPMEIAQIVEKFFQCLAARINDELVSS